MNINSLATIKNEKSISKIQYGKYLAEATFKNMFSLKEIVTPILSHDFFYKVNEPLKLNQKEDIYFSNDYDDVLSFHSDIVMEKGHIYKFKAYKITYNNLKDISETDKTEMIKNIYENKILLEIIDLYDYLKDDMLPDYGDFSSELGAKVYYIVLENEEELEKFINKMMILRASKEELNKALAATRQDIKEKALKEKEGWTSLTGSGYKGFKIYTDAYESYNKFKHENNYTEDLKTFLKNTGEDEIKKVIPELINTEGNLVKDRVGCFINLYEDLDKNKNYYKILKEAVENKTKENLFDFNSKEAKEEAYENLKTKALYIANENLEEYIASSIKSKLIKRYSSSTDKETSMLTKNGIGVFENISKNEYIKYLQTDELKSKLLKTEDFNNIKEKLYYLNDSSSKEKLKTFLLENFKFPEENLKLFIDNILNNQYYSAKNQDDISKIIKFIDDKGYIFITYTKYFNRLEDDLLKCIKYKQAAFEEIEEYINIYSLIFNLDEIEELNTLEDLRKIFGEKDSLLNLREELKKAHGNIVLSSEEKFQDDKLISDILNSAELNIKDMEKSFDYYKDFYGIKESITLKDFFDVMPEPSRAEEVVSQNSMGLNNENVQALSLKIKYMSDEEYKARLEEINNINTLKEPVDYLISKYYGHDLNEEERKEAVTEIKDMWSRIAETADFYKDEGLINPFLYKIIKSNMSFEGNSQENHLKVMLGTSQESMLHSVNLKENDNLPLLHEIFQIFTGAKIENGELIDGSQIIVNGDEYKNSTGRVNMYVARKEENMSDNRVWIDYKSLETIERAVEDINKKTGHKNESLRSIPEKYLSYMFKNENFIYSMEQSANINLALAAQDHFSKYAEDEENNLKEKDSNENHESIYESRIKRAEIRDITTYEAVTDKGHIMPHDMGKVFKDTIIEDGNKKRVNAYKMNIEKLKLENPLYKDLFSKDMEGTYIYKALSDNYDPKEYARKSKIKPEISEIIIPAFKTKASEEEFEDNLINLKKTSADLINVLYELDKHSHEGNDYVKENNENAGRKDKPVLNLKVKAQKKLKDYYKALIYEMNDSNGYFKKSIKAQIENSAELNLSKAVKVSENKAGEYLADEFKKEFKNNNHNKDEIKSLNISENADYKNVLKGDKYNSIQYVNPKDIFGDNYKLAYESIGRQLITDNIDKSYELYSYMKENFIKDIESISDIKKKGRYLLKEKSALENIGEGYLKEIGIDSIVLSDLDRTSPLVRFTKTYVDDNVPKGYTHLDSVTQDKLQGHKIKVFFEGIRKSGNGNYFLRSKEETQYITDMMKSIGINDYKEFINKKYSKDEVKSWDISDDYKEDKNNSHIRNQEKADILHKLLKKQRDKVYDYNYCLNRGKISYLERNEASKINRNIDAFIGIFEKELADNKGDIGSENIKEKLKISDDYINNINILCNLRNPAEYRTKALKNLKEDAFSLALKQGSNISINEVFKDLKKVLEDPKSNSVINEKFYEKGIFEHCEGNKLSLYKKIDSISKKAIGKVQFKNKGIFKEVYSRNYGEDAPVIDGKKVLQGDRIYSFNIEDAGLLKVLGAYRNKKGSAELKLKDVQRNKVKKFQEKSFEDISRRLNHYKIALLDKTDETILNEIKEKIKKEYIDNFPKSFEMLDKIFNKIHSDDSDIHIKAFEEIRKEYDKDKVTDYVNTIQVLKNKKMITEEEITHVSEKISEQLKKSGTSREEYKENLYDFLKKSRKFKERNIDTLPKVENFLKAAVTNESIGNARTVEAVEKEKQYPRININEAEGVLKEQSESIIKNLKGKDDSAHKAGKKAINSYMQSIKEEDKNNEKVLNSIYEENAYNPQFLDKALNINENSTKDLESINKVKIGYGKHAGLSIGELSNKSLSEILTKDYSDKLNYKVNKQLLKKTKSIIYNAKRLNKDGIINKEDKNTTKEKLKARLGDSYINEMQKSINEEIKEKGRHKKKESSMYNAPSSIKAAFEGKAKNRSKVSAINKPLTIGRAASSENLAVNIEPNITAKPKGNMQRASEPINMANTNYENIPRSDTRYYADQKTGNAINISAKSPSNSTGSDMSQLISKAIGGSHLNINTNFMDSRRKVTQAEINGMIENSIK